MITINITQIPQNKKIVIPTLQARIKYKIPLNVLVEIKYSTEVGFQFTCGSRDWTALTTFYLRVQSSEHKSSG